MHEFHCAHEECRSEFVESDRDDLMRRVGDHLRESHNVGRLTETLRSYLEETSVDEVHEFHCAHEECRSEFVESDRDDLMRRVGDHLRESHNVGRLTETLRSYLEETSMTAR